MNHTYRYKDEILETGQDVLDEYKDYTTHYYAPDWTKRYLFGPRYFRINGQEVSQEEFERRVQEIRAEIRQGVIG